MGMIVEPTVGSVLWYYPAEGDPSFPPDYNAPFAAHVAYVWSDSCVNLMVIGPEGQPTQKTFVRLVQTGDSPEQAHCVWPASDTVPA